MDEARLNKEFRSQELQELQEFRITFILELPTLPERVPSSVV
jgi:hypothetical protein